MYHASDTDFVCPDLPTLSEIGTISNSAGFVDPYDPTEMLFTVEQQVHKLNINTSVSTLLSNFTTGVGGHQRRQFSNKSIYHIYTTKILNAGIELKNRMDAPNQGTYLNNPDVIVFNHAIVSVPNNTTIIQSFCSSPDGSAIYYSTQSEQISKYDSALNTSSLLCTGDGTASMRGVSLDPLDQKSLVF